MVQLFTGGLLLGGSLYILLLLFAPYTETPRALGEGVSSILGRVLHRWVSFGGTCLRRWFLLPYRHAIGAIHSAPHRRRLLCRHPSAGEGAPDLAEDLGSDRAEGRRLEPLWLLRVPYEQPPGLNVPRQTRLRLPPYSGPQQVGGACACPTGAACLTGMLKDWALREPVRVESNWGKGVPSTCWETRDLPLPTL